MSEPVDHEFYARSVDPWVRQALFDRSPWDATSRIYEFTNLFVDDESLAHGGALYTVWMELTDLMEIGRSSLNDRHTVLHTAAVDWLRRTRSDDPDYVAHWIERTSNLVHLLMERDGNIVWGTHSAL